MLNLALTYKLDDDYDFSKLMRRYMRYIYCKEPNELRVRLRLLHVSPESGKINYGNEINVILKELNET